MDKAPVRVSIRDVSYSYPEGMPALSGVSLDVHEGEFIGILGANGSGKTTLLKLADGIIKNYSGSVLLDGSDVRKLSPRDIYRKMGLVFQNPDDQLFAPTVFEDVAFGPLNMGCSGPDVEGRVMKALEAVGMGECVRRNINHLSYGQKKRVSIAGLLAMGHEILLMDEPTAGLDPMGEYRMMELLTRLNRQRNVTIVMATNSVELVPLFLHRLYILSKGVLKRGGRPEEVFTAPGEMADVKLRLPQIAELIWKLKNEDGVPFEKVPLTVGEARRLLLGMLRETG
ncbi:MAG: ATP-binding cassette domain-containing protein [Nitrospiraceae bacterium]|nr:ATP-binding cassette domain-containing protein [Nitrospiraceae bacterium]